mmetsp:Transcript_5735/g.18010  ORF Transcript_5735/g.18010 Transcript_5735/m.18010 type:complete len:220 (-) Transcript_5735:350-1009(-)
MTRASLSGSSRPKEAGPRSSCAMWISSSCGMLFLALNSRCAFARASTRISVGSECSAARARFDTSWSMRTELTLATAVLSCVRFDACAKPSVVPSTALEPSTASDAESTCDTQKKLTLPRVIIAAVEKPTAEASTETPAKMVQSYATQLMGPKVYPHARHPAAMRARRLRGLTCDLGRHTTRKPATAETPTAIGIGRYGARKKAAVPTKETAKLAAVLE